MATLKDHQQAMVDLLASGSGIPASASRLAHAMHDVLETMLTGVPSAFSKIDMTPVKRAYDATTPGLNDKALAGDLEACRPKATPAERRVKELENTVKQLRAINAVFKAQRNDYAKRLADLGALEGTGLMPEQAGIRKDDTQACEHDSWEDVAHGDKRCCDCGELFK